MTVALITGAAGLVGFEASLHFSSLGMDVIGIDNDLRAYFFGPQASTAPQRDALKHRLGSKYEHHDTDVRDAETVNSIIERVGESLSVVVHAAAQPSHDWAARDPMTDYEINALGTLNLLESTRRYAPDTPFVFLSTNKVYGDRPNYLPFEELDTRWELPDSHTYRAGVREDMPVDQCLHSLFGASKLSADVLVQEYGRYFGMKTVCFRAGTITGSHHAAAELHGFLAYLMRCAMTRQPYRVFGYKGKQVRDAIHARDLVLAFDQFVHSPGIAKVYNIGGGRDSNTSVLEALGLVAEIVGHEVEHRYDPTHRTGDHIWWISDNGHFQADYPSWRITFDIDKILREIHETNTQTWRT